MGTRLHEPVKRRSRGVFTRLFHRLAHSGVNMLVMSGWLWMSLCWLGADRLVRDGDEEGHVGAAELFLEQARHGAWGRYLRDAWYGDLGEYPPLFPALTGAWWWATGQGRPGTIAVRAICLGGLLLAAVATAALARRTVGGDNSTAAARRGTREGSAEAAVDRAEAARQGRIAAATALALVLALPLGNGLARHFMPEGLLTGAVALAVLAAVRAGERPTTGRALALGLAVGAGLLVKQTFVLYMLAPVVWIARRLGWRWAVAGTAALAVAGPWYLGHLGAQLIYGSASAAAHRALPLWVHLVYYPVVGGWIAWGPVVGGAAAIGLVVLLGRGQAGGTPRDRRAAALGAVWLLGGLLGLVLVPKKYPRLLAPLAPAAVIWAAGGLSRLGRRWAVATGLVAFAWTAWWSWHLLPAPPLVEHADPGCLQRWLRPPVADDLGLSAVARAVREAAPGPVAVIDGPEIPCTVQTTHAWIAHLGPYLRRAGVERDVVDGPDPRAAVVVDWSESRGGQEVRSPALGRAFRLRITRRRDMIESSTTR